MGGAGNCISLIIIIKNGDHFSADCFAPCAMAGSMLLIVSILLAVSAVLVKSEGEAGEQANAATAFRPQFLVSHTPPARAIECITAGHSHTPILIRSHSVLGRYLMRN